MNLPHNFSCASKYESSFLIINVFIFHEEWCFLMSFFLQLQYKKDSYLNYQTEFYGGVSGSWRLSISWYKCPSWYSTSLSFSWNYFSIVKGILHKFLWFYYFPSNILIKFCFVAVRKKIYARVDAGTYKLLLWSILPCANQHCQVKFLMLSWPTFPP